MHYAYHDDEGNRGQEAPKEPFIHFKPAAVGERQRVNRLGSYLLHIMNLFPLST